MKIFFFDGALDENMTDQLLKEISELLSIDAADIKIEDGAYGPRAVMLHLYDYQGRERAQFYKVHGNNLLRCAPDGGSLPEDENIEDCNSIVVLTNSLLAMDTDFCWNSKEDVPDCYIFISGKFIRVDQLTDRELRRGHVLSKMYCSGEFGRFVL